MRPRTTSTQECPSEIRAVWRALLLPFEDGANGPERAESAGAQHPAAWRDSLLLDSEEASFFLPDSGAFNSFIGDGFLVPELKGGNEASDDVQADNVSNEALYDIGLHGSGDNISLLTRLGGGKGSFELPKSLGHAVPRIIRS